VPGPAFVRLPLPPIIPLERLAAVQVVNQRGVVDDVTGEGKTVVAGGSISSCSVPALTLVLPE